MLHVWQWRNPCGTKIMESFNAVKTDQLPLLDQSPSYKTLLLALVVEIGYLNTSELFAIVFLATMANSLPNTTDDASRAFL